VVSGDYTAPCCGIRIVMCLYEFHSNHFNPQRY
jgi:hypothetical protein